MRAQVTGYSLGSAQVRLAWSFLFLSWNLSGAQDASVDYKWIVD